MIIRSEKTQKIFEKNHEYLKDRIISNRAMKDIKNRRCKKRNIKSKKKGCKNI